LEIAECQRGRLPVEGLGVGDLGGGQLHSASTQIEVDEEGAGDGQWVDGRADVVGDARRHSQVEGASTPADGGLSLEDLHRESGAGQGHCGSQAVGSGTDDDCINLSAHVVSLAWKFHLRSPKKEYSQQEALLDSGQEVSPALGPPVLQRLSS